MFSCTYTGMNLFPLCTAKVCPTNSGGMVQARAQVLITRFWLTLFNASTFWKSFPLMNGPFFSDRVILLPSFHDVFAGGIFLLAGLVALRRDAPGGLRVLLAAAALRPPLAAPHRVVDRVHRHAARLRPDA